MSEDYSARQPIATWNPARGVWETSQVNLLCAHLEPWQEVWPTSGMTVNGQVFELPTLARPTTVSESSSLPTPRAQEPGSTSPGYGDSLNDFASRVTTGYAPKDLLRSPTASQGEGGALGEDEARKRGNTVGIRDQAMDIAKANGHKVSRLIGTPRTSSANYATQKQVVAGAPKGRLEDQVLTTDWGKFEPAIRRWEETLGRPAPAPTKPDGKDSAHRLSSAFTEWMMGLPEGWITDCGLTRNEELKACGNGVVPQQAELALRILLDGLVIELEAGQELSTLDPQ